MRCGGGKEANRAALNRGGVGDWWGLGFESAGERRGGRREASWAEVGDGLGVSGPPLRPVCEKVAWLCDIGTDRNGGSGDATGIGRRAVVGLGCGVGRHTGGGGAVENARQGGLANLAKFGVMHAKEKRESRERKEYTHWMEGVCCCCQGSGFLVCRRCRRRRRRRRGRWVLGGGHCGYYYCWQIGTETGLEGRYGRWTSGCLDLAVVVGVPTSFFYLGGLGTEWTMTMNMRRRLVVVGR